jgi:hypothetical protein
MAPEGTTRTLLVQNMMRKTTNGLKSSQAEEDNANDRVRVLPLDVI